MANEQALHDVINSPFSSESQRENATAALYKIANPDRVTPVGLVEPLVKPGELPRYDWLAALVDLTILDEGSVAREEWVAGAALWLEAIESDPQYSADQKIEGQARHAHYTAPRPQRYAEEAAEQLARSADKAEIEAHVRAAYPNWNSVQIYNEMLDLRKAEGNVSWKTVDGVPTKIRFDDKWETWEKFESLP